MISESLCDGNIGREPISDKCSHFIPLGFCGVFRGLGRTWKKWNQWAEMGYLVKIISQKSFKIFRNISVFQCVLYKLPWFCKNVVRIL